MSDQIVSKSNTEAVSRRFLFKSAAAVTTAIGASTAIGAEQANAAILGDSTDIEARKYEAFLVRLRAARANQRTKIRTQKINGDEEDYSDYRGNFSKTLPHNHLGEVDVNAYENMVSAIDSGDIYQIENIPSGGGGRKLANPLAGNNFNLEGSDSKALSMSAAPAFASLETAAEMGEVYWKAALREISFDTFEDEYEIQRAANELNLFSETVGPKEGGKVTPKTIFRGETAGDLVGPYISQFLYMDVPSGPATLVQKYKAPAPDTSYMTNDAEYLAVQNGATPARSDESDAKYIINGRYLSTYVHYDYSYQAYLNAALILLATPDSIDLRNPYSGLQRQGAFTSYGGPDILGLIAQVSSLALKAAWHQKWNVHRRLRPEVYGKRLQVQAYGQKDYGLPDEIIHSDILGHMHWLNNSFLLPMAYPEGSPTHPAFPAGHATIAGACVTILKAFFDEDAVLENPVVPTQSGYDLTSYNGDELTIGGELNKLANNISLGRDWAGVHYRSDGIDGMALGQHVAMRLLQDVSRTYQDSSDGFYFRTFNGREIHIYEGKTNQI